jgi:DNA polymerase-1
MYPTYELDLRTTIQMSSPLYRNDAALLDWLTAAFPALPEDLLLHARSIQVEAAQAETKGGPVLLTSLPHAPEDADWACREGMVTLGPGPLLFGVHRLSADEQLLDGLPLALHHRYRWALTKGWDERVAKRYARDGCTATGIATRLQPLLAAMEQADPPALRPLPAAPVVHVAPSRGGYQLVTPETEPEYLAAIRAAPRLGFDTETMPREGWTDCPVKGGLRKRWDRVCGFSISTTVGTGWYLNVGPAGAAAPPAALTATMKALADPALTKVGWNARFDLMMLRESFGVQVQGRVEDAQIAAHLLGAYDQETGLKRRAKEDLGVEMTEITTFIGAEGRYAHMGRVPLDLITAYAAPDADVPLRLLDQYLPQLAAQGLLPSWELEVALVPILHHMEWKGMHPDLEQLAILGLEMEQEIARTQRSIEELAGDKVNIRSPLQLSTLLYSKLGLPRLDPRKRKLYRVKGGEGKAGYATDKDTLLELLITLPEGLERQLLILILRQRQLLTLDSSFVQQLPRMVNPTTRRIHQSLNSTRAETGRLSSSEPNLENIPARSELGKRLRQAFTGQDAAYLLVADKSQIEPRILAHITQEPGLLEVYRTPGADLYRSVGSRILGVEPGALTKLQRDVMKTITLATQYGGQAFTIAKRATNPLADPPVVLTQAEAQSFLEGYFAHYPGIPRYMRETIASVRGCGYAETLMGRRRWLPNIGHYDASLRMAAERAGINHPIQGTAGELLKLAMLKVAEAGLLPYLVNPVHDELIGEFPTEAEARDALEPWVKAMESCYELTVPIRVEAGVGRSWAEAKG